MTLNERLQNPKTQRQAFEEIVSQYSERLYWVIRHIVTTHDDTDDVLQNTFLKAWTHLSDFRGDSQIGTWLHRIAVNEALAFVERRNHQVLLDADDVSTAGHLMADEYFDGDEVQQQLQRAVDSLPEKQRAVFTLKYFDEMKYEEMSQILGTSVGALKASYHHAVKKISQFFSDED